MPLYSVEVRREPVIFPTYEPLPPDKNPMFLERRVYQGSSGKVYPLACYNRISETKCDRAWDAVMIENEFLQVMILPELGGRIHVGRDKTNGYDFFYRQDVIKPALVGLAGPWASGGVEFNWPQHHRPATFMPVEVEIQRDADGSVTVWLSDHDPLERMKGMHGVRLAPGRSVIELKMRAYNRTPYVQTFLWWANVATAVHEGYQSFFPPDVAFVADHAKRAVSHFPLCQQRYYGVDYAARAAHGVPPDEVPAKFIPPHGGGAVGLNDLPYYAPNDLSWYANIPVPTSYMCLGSKQDFSGGYDHFNRAGFVQIADHHIAPGKKQWTWGNHEFGYAWDRNLSDDGIPYIELMLGVFTDNQPDFSFLQPGETKSWSVFWYPIQKIGPAQAANSDAAVSLQMRKATVNLGVAVTRAQPQARVELIRGTRIWREWVQDLAPDWPLVVSVKASSSVKATQLQVRLCDSTGRELISYRPGAATVQAIPPPAAEPLPPDQVPSADELYTIGLHLAQYRHATRSPVLYWREALRRDPGDARCNTAMGNWHFRRGEYAVTESFLRRAVTRLTSRNANPYDGEAYYALGLVLAAQESFDEAYDAYAKAAWNQAWRSAAFHNLAEIDVRRGHWDRAIEHLDQSLVLNAENLRAQNLRAICRRQQGRTEDFVQQVTATLQMDPLDGWARQLRGDRLTSDPQVRLDLALDYARAGLFEEALAQLADLTPDARSGVLPLCEYYRAFLLEKLGRREEAVAAGIRAEQASPDYCFPARLEEIAILTAAIARNPRDARARYYLGNLYYDRRRYEEAIRLWEQSARLDGSFAIVWRNLGLAYFNVSHDSKRALRAYERACRANRQDARLVYERDQLLKRTGEDPPRRLRWLEERWGLVGERDDASVELCALYNQCGRPERALEVLTSRRFQPWEGGEGLVLAQYTRTRLKLGRNALARGEVDEAIRHFEAALRPPRNLAEARHLLANCSDITYALGLAYRAAGRNDEAQTMFQRAARARGDFQEMRVRQYSELTYYSGRALQALGKKREANGLFRRLDAYAHTLMQQPASIDYFATSLPTMLLFDDDLQFRQVTTALFLEAQAALGLGRGSVARRKLKQVLVRDPNHPGAADLASETRMGKGSAERG